MNRIEITEKNLRQAFAPERLEIINESEQHAGHHHDGRPHQHGGGAETHFRVRIVSSAFSGKSRLDRHRAVNEALDEVIKDGLHALAVEAAAPGEATRW